MQYDLVKYKYIKREGRDTHLVNENPGVCGEPGERHHDVVVEPAYLLDGALLLQLGHGLLLDPEHDHAGAADADRRRALLHRLLRVLHLPGGVEQTGA